MEFSKKLAVGVMIVYAVLVFLCLFCKYKFDTSVEGLLGIVTPIPVTVVGFYYNKAKNENLVKIQNSLDK